MTRHEAERLAAEALLWLAGDADRIETFLAASGASPDELRAQAGDPAFLGFVLDHILMADDSVLAFAQSAGIAPDRVLAARAGLPGGDLPNWT